MPVCVFGCDFLYENEHIFIFNRRIVIGLPINVIGQEQEILKLIVGRNVDKNWLKGPSTYFDTQTLCKSIFSFSPLN
jgi:hypothetical protein